MSEDMKPNAKKGLPGGFLLFIFAIILIIMAIQSLTNESKAKVSFSYQIEHLVNLDLLQPGSGRKIALNDNLVTFSGKFRDQLAPESEKRFHYLELLNQNHQLQLKKATLEEELDLGRKEIQYVAGWFFYLTDKTLPKEGAPIVSAYYDTLQKSFSVQLKELPAKEGISLKSLETKLQQIKNEPTAFPMESIGGDILSLLESYSSHLGIGDEALKQEFLSIQNQAESLQNQSGEKKLEGYGSILRQLSSFSDRLFQEQNHAHLTSLRSVRAYLADMDQYKEIEKQLEANKMALDKAREAVADTVWFFNNKELSTKALEKEDFDHFSRWFSQASAEWEHFSLNKGAGFKAPDQPRTLVLDRTFQSEEPSPNYFSYLLTLLPVILVVLVLYFLFTKQMKGVGSSALNFGKSPAKLLTKESNKVTFKDVAGAEEAKEELEEIVDFLKDPHKFTALGARIPKGVLLVGPPGTGKTLIAKAVAGEADRPFFSISGSDFVEMFVGVGASRVRDLFDQAKKNAPCIIFMDEIDAVGRHRGAGIGGGHDEREQTLNQLLVEMDGFDTKEGVILMAATNRPDILDKALLRPGRFDRRVVLDLPDVKGRYEILKVHARHIKIDPSVDLMEIARNTPGASGADLGNILNESALLAARKGRSAVTSVETREACDKVRFGKERRSLEMDLEEKKTTAFHESGHAIVGLKVERSDPVDKVTIIPRGFALGATHFMPKKNRLSYWKKEAIDQLAIFMGGRAAEEIFIEDLSSGAQQDIASATKLARAMVCEWGMSGLGTISFDERSDQNPYLSIGGYHEKLYSEQTAQKIDQEVTTMIQEAHQRALKIIQENKDKVQLMAEMLMEFETLDAQDVKEIMSGEWNAEKKRARLKSADELQKKTPPPIPEVKQEIPPLKSIPSAQ
jgi:cell division protease FtsH